MQEVVLITHEENQEEIVLTPVWHATTNFQPEGYQTICCCSLEGGAVYETKHVKRGGVTCPTCLTIIKDAKFYKL